MLRIYLVVAAFSARQLERDPIHVEEFAEGERLIAMRTEDFEIVFSRLDESSALDDLPEFAISAREFEIFTEASPEDDPQPSDPGL